MATKKSKKSAKRPKVPEAERVPALTAPSEMKRPEYEPMSLNDFQNWMNTAYNLQLRRFPEVLATQKQAQSELFRNMASLQREQGPQHAAIANQLLGQYNPEFRQQYGAQQADINTLGQNVKGELAAGYQLGPALEREVTQALRGAQTARGNILGAAPTAQEAFGRGQAALNLYQQRLGNYNQFLGQQQNFLQGRNPTDVMGQMAGTYLGANYYPSQAYVDTGLGAQSMAAAGSQAQQFNQIVQSGYSTFQNALQNYNQNQISATEQNNVGLFNTYDRRAESWMYDEAVRRGLYSTPSVGGGGGMMGGMGGILSGVGGGIASGIGIAAAGGGATAAIGGGAAAAISAAGAAICWLARRCLPDRWEEFQRYLFTDAPETLRRLYIYNARRLAREITEDEAIEIGELMDDCINLRSLA
jgi:hypothetical protein